MLLQRLLRSSLALFLLFSTLLGDAHIFVYHRFDDGRYPTTNTSLKELEKEFLYLQTHGYKVIPLHKLVQALKTHQSIDDRWVVLTIDDGFKSFLRALPLFRRFHYPFTLFISTNPIEKGYPDFLNWKDMKMIAKYGEIAFHSHSHPHLCDLNDTAIKQDTNTGLEILEKRLGIKPRSYAYPYGEYDKRVEKIITSFGFEAICNQNIGAIDSSSNPLSLDRIAMVGKVDIKRALSYKHLQAQWIEPKRYPKNGILKKIVVKISPKYHFASIYVTGFGWMPVKVKNGIVDIKTDYRLTKRRVRVIIKVKNSKINTKLLVRSRYGVE